MEKLLKAVDTDGVWAPLLHGIKVSTPASGEDRQMSLVEFHQYVARMGGSLRLFEIRRKQMEAKHGWGPSVCKNCGEILAKAAKYEASNGCRIRRS